MMPPPSTRETESKSRTMMVVAVAYFDNLVRSRGCSPSATLSIP